MWCSLLLHQHSVFSVSSVPFSLQSLSPLTSLQPEVQVSTHSTPPPDQVTGDESPGHRMVEVAIPHVGTFVIESEEGGYDDEVVLAQRNFLPDWFVAWAHHCPFMWLLRFFTPEKIWLFLPADFRINSRLKTLTSLLAFLCYSCVKSIFLSQSASWHKGSFWPFAKSLGLWKKTKVYVMIWISYWMLTIWYLTFTCI